MTVALRAGGLPSGDEQEMLAYFEMAANQLMNAG